MTRITLPPRWVKDYGTLLTDFTTVTATAGTMTTNAADTSVFLSGTQSWHMVLDSATDTLGQARFNTPIDLSNTRYVHVWIKDMSGNNTNDLGTDSIINFFAVTDAYATTTNKYKGTNSATGWPESPMTGWKRITFHVDEFTTTGSPTGLANVQWFWVEMDNRGGNDAEVYFDSVYLDQKSRPKLVWMFDDGSESDYTEAFDYLYTTKGKLGTSFIISETMAAGSELTVAQAQEMYAAGWDIANHSNDATALNGISTSAAIAKLDTCRDYLIANGMPKMANYFAYPSNLSTAALIDDLGNTNYVFGRAGQKSTDHFPSIMGHPDSTDTPPFNPLYFPPTVILNETNYDAGAGTGAVQKGYALDAASQGAVILVSTHKIVSTGATGVQTNQASFREFVDWTIEMEQMGYWDIVPLSEVMNPTNRRLLTSEV